MSHVSRVIASLAALGLSMPTPVLAHAGGEPFIHVPADRVLQGETFTVVAADLGEGALVALEISSSGESFPLGEVVAQPDGHFTETFVMPADVDDGYAELWARSSEGAQVMLWILVGEAADPGAPGSASAAPEPDAGPSLPIVLLLAAWVVGLLAIGLVLLRSRKPVARRPHRRL